MSEVISASKTGYKWINITKECNICNFRDNSLDKNICRFGGLIRYIFTKSNRIRNKCMLKNNT